MQICIEAAEVVILIPHKSRFLTVRSGPVLKLSVFSGPKVLTVQSGPVLKINGFLSVQGLSIRSYS